MTSADPWGAPVRGLVVDLDDTLLDTVGAMHAAAAEAARGVWPGCGELADRFAALVYDDPLGCFDAFTRGERTFAEQRSVRTRHAAAECGLAGFEGGLEEAYGVAYDRAFAGAQRLYADVVPFLDAAAAAGVGVCVLTNANDAVTAMKLQAVGLTGRLPQVTTDTFGVGKPDPRLYRRAAELAGCAPEDAVCVGDTWATDVLGARGAGLRAAWLQRSGARPPRASAWETPFDDPGIRIVRSLAEVAVLL